VAFLVGLLILAGCIAWMVREARSPRFGWLETPGGRTGRLLLDSDRDNLARVTVLRLGVAIDPALDVTLRREGWLERCAKALRLVREPQLGRAEFDARFWLAAAHPDTLARMRADPGLLREIDALVGYDAGFRFHRLVCRDGVLLVELRPLSRDAATDVAIAWFERRLVALADRLPPGPPRTALPADPFRLRAGVLLGVGSGLAIAGMINAYRIWVLPFPNILDAWRLVALAGPFAAAMLGLGLVSTLALLSGSVQLRRVLPTLLLLGVIGAPTTAWTSLHDWNCDFDDSVAEPTPMRVVARERHRTRRVTHYTLSLEDGRPQGAMLRVGHHDYERFAPGSRVIVWEHRGALGVRWAARVSAAPP
jgi:hypothetical protein